MVNRPQGIQDCPQLPQILVNELFYTPVEQFLASLFIEQWGRSTQLGIGNCSYDRTGMDSGEIRSSIILDLI
jgi:hypothetical protein